MSNRRRDYADVTGLVGASSRVGFLGVQPIPLPSVLLCAGVLMLGMTFAVSMGELIADFASGKYIIVISLPLG